MIILCSDVLVYRSVQIAEGVMEENRMSHKPGEAERSLPKASFQSLNKDDAFQTIMSWLYTRMRNYPGFSNWE